MAPEPPPVEPDEPLATSNVRAANRQLDPRDPAYDPAAGAAALRAAAAQGVPLAAMGLGQRLIHGIGLPADPAAGEAYLHAAADAEFPPAMEAWGRHRLATDPADGAGWLRRAAEAGFAPAMAAWAACLLAGTGVPPDLAEADRWLAAGMGANLGRAFAMAAERATDPGEQERLLTEALRRRDVPAGLTLGMRRYARQDFAGAARAFAACLTLGAEAACINVAAMVRRGEWPPDRPAPPVEDLLGPLAAEGDAFAAINLALWRDVDAAAGRACVATLPPGPGRDAAHAWWHGLEQAGDPEGVRVMAWWGSEGA